MGLFDLFHRPDIDQGVQECLNAGATLLDVRTPQEYREGHIPGSRNIPLQKLETSAGLPDAGDTPLYVYCQSGARSRQAAALLREMGYARVKDLGGIAAYSGKVERGA